MSVLGLIVLAQALCLQLAMAQSVDVKQYSYICVKASQDLCLGISPGEFDPVYDPNVPPYLLQLKRREKNEEAALDYKKTRWDVRFQENLISLSRFPDLCISLPSAKSNPNELALYPCTEVEAGQRAGKFNMEFNTNINEESTIQLLGTEDCVTVVTCKAGDLGFCDPASEGVPVNGNFKSGTYVKIKACYWSKNGDPKWQSAQTFVQALDCATGCTPMLQNNDVCDIPCANHQCNLDNGHCLTAAPTPPTFSPSAAPTFTPSRAPTTLAPTSSPVTSKPTTSPTVKPTHQPTSRVPSKIPTVKPTKAPTLVTSSPTKKPTGHPTSLAPSSSPTVRPSYSPSQAPVQVPDLQGDPPTPEPSPAADSLNAVVVVAVTVPLLLLLLLCLVLLLVMRERRKRQARGAKSWSSLIDVNQAAFVEHHRNKRKPFCTRVRETICCQRHRESKPPSVTTLSSHLPVDHIIVTASPDTWQPQANKNKRRPKLTGVGDPSDTNYVHT